MITGRPEHLKAFDYLGLHRYFLTFCTFERRPIFVTRERTESVHEQFLRAAVDEGFAVLALRSDESTLAVARFILENPIRAGLVERAQDYPFLGSGVYSIDEILEAVEWRSG